MFDDQETRLEQLVDSLQQQVFSLAQQRAWVERLLDRQQLQFLRLQRQSDHLEQEHHLLERGRHQLEQPLPEERSLASSHP